MAALEQAIITWIHLISASIWVGGSLFIGIVFSPLLKTMTSSVEERMQIMIRVGKRFNKVAIGKPDLLISTSYGTYLIIKIILVIALIITYAVHVRVIRKDVEEKIMLNKMSEFEIQKLRKKIIILGEITVVLSVAILFFASLLDAGV